MRGAVAKVTPQAAAGARERRSIQVTTILTHTAPRRSKAQKIVQLKNKRYTF